MTTGTSPATPPIPGWHSFIYNADSAPAYWMQGILWIILAHGDDTGGRFSMMEQLLPQGSGPPPHKHTWSDETFYLLDGKLTFLTGDEVHTARTGDFVVVPHNTRHAFRVESETARLLNGYTPASMEALIADMGTRIAKALVARGAAVRTLVRTDAANADKHKLTKLGATLMLANVSDVASVAAACEGAACVVSALNGLYDVIIDRQTVLLDAAVKAGVPRFISSDYSLDFTKTERGGNRNLDLRREFMGRADRAPINMTSILNGGFMDMLGAEMPIIQPRIRRVLYWGSADQPLNFSTKDDVAAYTVAAALDDTTPRILRIASDTVSARDIARIMTSISGARYRPFRAGSIASLERVIQLTKLVAPQPRAVFPVWQGMQYMRDMFNARGRLDTIDITRYPDLHWTSVRDNLGSRAIGVHQFTT